MLKHTYMQYYSFTITDESYIQQKLAAPDLVWFTAF